MIEPTLAQIEALRAYFAAQDDQLAAGQTRHALEIESKIEASVELSRSDRFWVEWMLPLTRPL